MSDPIRKHRPLVFANACGSAEAGRHLGDFGPCFIQLGAVAFVGAFANINKDVAVKFAHRFYEQLLIPEEKNKIHRTIGQALWQTKKAFSDEGERDPSYLFYRLYGPPDTCFQLDSGK